MLFKMACQTLCQAISQPLQDLLHRLRLLHLRLRLSTSLLQELLPKIRAPPSIHMRDKQTSLGQARCSLNPQVLEDRLSSLSSPAQALEPPYTLSKRGGSEEQPLLLHCSSSCSRCPAKANSRANSNRMEIRLEHSQEVVHRTLAIVTCSPSRQELPILSA